MRSFRILACLLVLGACGGDDAATPDAAPDDPDAEPEIEDSATVTIGADGGTIRVTGLTLTIPPGALDDDTEITVTRTDDAPPTDAEAQSPVYEFLPTGTTFAEDATLAIDVTGDVTGSALQWTTDGTIWDAIAGTESDGVFTASIGHFSFGFLGRFPFTTGPTGRTTWDPPGALQGLETFGLVDTGAGLFSGVFHIGVDGLVYGVSAPDEGTPVSIPGGRDIAGGRLLRGVAPIGTGFATSGRLNNGVDAALFASNGDLVRAIGTSATGEGKAVAALDDGGIGVVGFQGATTKVILFDAGLTSVAGGVTIPSSFGLAIAPGVGSGVVAVSTRGIFRIDGAGAVTWQKSINGPTGSIVAVVRFGSNYAVVGNFNSAPHVVVLDDTGAVVWQRVLGNTPAGTAVAAAGASVIGGFLTSYLWVGGRSDASSMEWFLDADGELVGGGTTGAGEARYAIGDPQDMLVAGITTAGLTWISRHSYLNDFGVSCPGDGVTGTAAATSTLTVDDSILVPAPMVPLPTITALTITPASLAAPTVTETCR